MTLMELGTISVVPVSTAQPMEVVFTTRVLALALASPTSVQAIQRVLAVPVILEQGQVLVMVFTVPIGKEMAVFFL